MTRISISVATVEYHSSSHAIVEDTEQFMEQPATGTRHNPTYICIYTAVDSVITLRKNGFSYISEKINTSQIGIGRNVIHSLRPLFVIDKDSLCIAACHHVTDGCHYRDRRHEDVRLHPRTSFLRIICIYASLRSTLHSTFFASYALIICKIHSTILGYYSVFGNRK